MKNEELINIVKKKFTSATLCIYPIFTVKITLEE